MFSKDSNEREALAKTDIQLIKEQLKDMREQMKEMKKLLTK